MKYNMNLEWWELWAAAFVWVCVILILYRIARIFVKIYKK